MGISILNETVCNYMKLLFAGLSRRKQGFESPRERHNNKQSEKLKYENLNPCSFVRHRAAIFYDGLLLGSVFFVCDFCINAIYGGDSIERGILN